MSQDPWYLTLLDKLGVNTTKLRWQLYRREQQAKNLAHQGVGRGPFAWMSYQHKVCPNCRAINDREAAVCTSCEKQLPSMLGYRLRRMAATIVPAEGPVVSMAFLGLMLLFFGLQVALDPKGLGGLMTLDNRVSIALGAMHNELVFGFGHWWRVLGFGFVHGGLIHFGMNSYVLFQIGPVVETQITRMRMLALITIAQIGAALACLFAYSANGALVVGASGWIFGLMGFGIGHFHRMGGAGRQMRDSLLRWAVIVLIIGFIVPGISNAAHIGGLAAGWAFSYIPDGQGARDTGARTAWRAFGGLCVGLWVATIVLAFRSLVQFWPDIQNL